MKEHIAYGGDVNATDHFGFTALHDVNDARTAELLIAAGADVNAKQSACVPFSLACYCVFVCLLVIFFLTTEKDAAK